jgi:hypothetical protein
VLVSEQILAQNYESVAPGRLSLFHNGCDIRGIEIENQSIGGNGEVIRENHSTVEFDTQGTIDTLSVIGELNEPWFADRPYELIDQGSDYRVSIRSLSQEGRPVLSVMENLANTGGDTFKFDGVWEKSAYLEGVGRIYEYHKTSTEAGPTLNTENDIWRLVYYEIDGEIWDYQNYAFHHGCIDQFLPVMVGIAQQEDRKFKVYLNPASGQFNLRGVKDKSIQIFNLTGSLIESNNLHTDVIRAELDAGIY